MSQSGLLPSVKTPSQRGADAGSGFDRRRLTTPACFAVAGVLLYFLYLAQASRTGFVLTAR